MNWEKSLFLGALVGMIVFVMAGCGTTVVETSATEQTPATTQPAPATTRQTSPPNTSINGTLPLPPGSGMPSDNRTPGPPPGFSNNGTMPGGPPTGGTPPSGPKPTGQSQ